MFGESWFKKGWAVDCGGERLVEIKLKYSGAERRNQREEGYRSRVADEDSGDAQGGSVCLIQKCK